MASIYLCDVLGDGKTPATAFRPAITTSQSFVCLMLDSAKMRALLVSGDDTITGPGVIRLATGTSMADLRQKAATTNPSGAKRTAAATWLSDNGYPPLPAKAVTWADVVQHIATTVNGAADLTKTVLA